VIINHNHFVRIGCVPADPFEEEPIVTELIMNGDKTLSMM
jgi:hypothetical protein